MTTSGSTSLKKIRDMLDGCAQGFSIENKKHRFWVKFKGKKFLLPKGEHGKKNPEIEKGHIKKMIKQLEIDLECAKECLELLK